MDITIKELIKISFYWFKVFVGAGITAIAVFAILFTIAHLFLFPLIHWLIK